jgi:hypothetical protein
MIHDYSLKIENTGLQGDGAWLVRLDRFDISSYGATLKQALSVMADYIAEEEQLRSMTDFELLDELHGGREEWYK